MKKLLIVFITLVSTSSFAIPDIKIEDMNNYSGEFRLQTDTILILDGTTNDKWTSIRRISAKNGTCDINNTGNHIVRLNTAESIKIHPDSSKNFRSIIGEQDINLSCSKAVEVKTGYRCRWNDKHGAETTVYGIVRCIMHLEIPEASTRIRRKTITNLKDINEILHHAGVKIVYIE